MSSGDARSLARRDGPTPFLLRARGVSKRFPGVVALDNVDFDLAPGEIHVLVGHNGAGKSTLIKIISGVYPSDAGEISTPEGVASFRNPVDAQRAGIATIHQEINLCAHLTVYENLILGREPLSRGRQIARRRAIAWARQHLARLGVDIDPRVRVENLPLSLRQLIAIAKALASEARVLILDEPTAVLHGPDIENLFYVLRGLRDQGVGIIYVSHRLAELHQIGDRVTVFRDGRRIETASLHEYSLEMIVEAMVGGELSQVFPTLRPPREEVALSIRGLQLNGRARPFSLDAHFGEIVGITGLVASGKERLAEVLSGGGARFSGEISVAGGPVRLTNYGGAVKAGIGYLSSDRRAEALILDRDANDNITLASLRRYCTLGVVKRGTRRVAVERLAESLGIRGPGLSAPLRLYSGGNQQKVSLAKWLDAESRILVMVEPTTGLDVGAKLDVYRLLRDLAGRGVTILLVSSDLEEVAGMSHRIVVLREGEIKAEFSSGVRDIAEILYEAVVGTHLEDREGSLGG